MAMTVREITAWLGTFPPDQLIGVGESGLCLADAWEEDVAWTYLEVGGAPDEPDNGKAGRSLTPAAGEVAADKEGNA